MRLRTYVVPAALLLTLTACGGSSSDQAAAPTPSTSTTSTSPSPAPTSSTPSTPSGGTSEEPKALTPSTALLDWKPVPGSTKSSVTRTVAGGGAWTLTVNDSSSTARLDGPHTSSGLGTSDRRVSDALLDQQYAVVVLQDKAQQRPSVATVTDLATGRSFTLDGSSDIPTTTGGTWALEGSRLVHATISGGAYCAVSVDLPTQTSTLGWCAPKKHGFNDAHLTPAGDSLLTFDDSRPACRTVVTLDGTDITPFPGVPDCSAWDSQLVDGGAVWSVVPKERAIDSAHFYARTGQDYFDLGPGTSGTLLWCSGASYFVRDPQKQGDPAALMRWTPTDGLSVAYQSPKGQAFLDQPRCGGNTLSVTALTSSGDQQVTVDLS